MAAGSSRAQNKRTPGRSNGGPPENPKLKGRHRPQIETEARQADRILHETALESFKEPAYPQRGRHEWTPVQLAAARLYGRGFSRMEVVRSLVDHICPPGTKNRKGYKLTPEARLRNARGAVRRWEDEQWFRDKIFDLAVVKTDLEIPGIMEGVVKKAKRGRVDAAKLALQVAGRMSTEETGGGNVTVVFGNIPRPENRGVVDVEVVEEEDVTEP